MKVFKDIISGDEMFSDSYPHELIYDDVVYEVKAKYAKKGNDQICIASDDIADDDGDYETVVDLADSFKLNEITFSKKDFMSYAKGFLKTMVTKLKENGKEDRIPGFKKGATDLVKFIAGKADEFQFFSGCSYDMDAGMCFAYQKNQEDAGPTFFFFADALIEEKFWKASQKTTLR